MLDMVALLQMRQGLTNQFADELAGERTCVDRESSYVALPLLVLEWDRQLSTACRILTHAFLRTVLASAPTTGERACPGLDPGSE